MCGRKDTSLHMFEECTVSFEKGGGGAGVE